MKITDEAVEAMLLSWFGMDYEGNHMEEGRAALEAALPHLSQGAVSDATYTEMLIDNAATVSQNTALVDDPVTREAIRLNIIDPLLALSSHEPAPTDTQDPAFDFYAHLKRQREWSEKTFGPGPRALGVIDHIRKELLEIEADPNDIFEWIDVAILALDGAWRAGYQPQEIIDAMVAKQTKNEGRQWPDWRTMPSDKAIEHDSPTDTQEGVSEAGEVVAWRAPINPYGQPGFTYTSTEDELVRFGHHQREPLVRLSALTACQQELERLRVQKDEWKERAATVKRKLSAEYERAEAAEARIAELVKELEKIKAEATIANDVIRLNRDNGGQGRVKVATAMHRIAAVARTALGGQSNE